MLISLSTDCNSCGAIHWFIGMYCVSCLKRIHSHILNEAMRCEHADVIKWKHFLRYWSFVRGSHRSLVNSPHKGQWRGALMFSLICQWTHGWVNNRGAGDLRRHCAHYDVIVIKWIPHLQLNPTNSWRDVLDHVNCLINGMAVTRHHGELFEEVLRKICLRYSTHLTLNVAY